MLTVDTEVRGARGLAIRYEQAPAVLSRNIVQVMRRVTARVHRAAVANVRGNGLKARTGNLARAIFWRIEVSGRDVIGRVGVDLARAIYGRIHELGGIIRARTAAKLTIPLKPALTGNGVARFTAREFMANPEAFGFRSAFRSRSGRALMGGREDGSAVAVFALADQVRLPNRRYLGRALSEHRDEIAEEFQGGVRDGLREAGLTTSGGGGFRSPGGGGLL